jgi:predicted ABC-type ATPase
MAWNQTQQEFEKLANEALELKTNFAFETNFHHDPMMWVNKFKSADFKVHLLFFALENINVAIERVAIRYQAGGHFVPNDEIEKRYFKGFENLDKHFQEFDSILIIETSTQNRKPQTIALIDSDKTVSLIHPTPNYFMNVCPLLTNYIEINKKSI